MTRRRTRTISVGLLTAVLVLPGCGQGTTPSSDPSSPSAAAGISTGISTSTGQAEDATLPGGQVTGRSGTYSVIAPAGWGEATDQAGTEIAGLDLVLLSSKKVSKFSNNLVVITAGGDAAIVKQKMETGRTRAASDGREVSDADSVQIAGVTAQGFTAKFEQKGVRITARSYGLAHDGKVYLLTLSSSQDDAENAMTAFERITGSWVWS